MNHSQFLTAIVFSSLFFFGCNTSPDKTGTASQQTKETILMDSLKKLDSLVLKYRAKNAEESIKYAREAGKLAQKINTPAALAKSYNILGIAWAGIRVDSGFYFYNKALMVIDSFNLTDKKGIGFEEPVASGLVNIGYRASDADSAIYYYTRAINMVSAEFAPEVIIGANNNLAYCYMYKGDLIKAEKCISEHALPIAVKTNNIDWQSTVYDTYADILERKGNSAGAMLNRKKAADAKNDFRTLVTPFLINFRPGGNIANP